MIDSNTPFVIGHRNPDMGSIAFAIGYSWVLNQAQSQALLPLVQVKLNAPGIVSHKKQLVPMILAGLDNF